MITFYEDKPMHCKYCHGSDYEIIEAEDYQARVSCVWCGKDTRWIEYSGKEQVTDESLFRFKRGRYQGMSIEEVNEEKGGCRYLMYLLQSSTSESLKNKIQYFYETKTAGTAA